MTSSDRKAIIIALVILAVLLAAGIIDTALRFMPKVEALRRSEASMMAEIESIQNDQAAIRSRLTTLTEYPIAPQADPAKVSK